MPRRYCCVFDCHNNDDIVKDWENATCTIHNEVNGLGNCKCQPRFILLPFPTKDVNLREEWIWRINRKNWQPNYNTRICSLHFVDVDLVNRKISPAHPYPTLNMGYSLSRARAKQKRKAPATRQNLPPSKRKYQKKLAKVPPSDCQDVEVPSHSNSCGKCNMYEEQIKKLQQEVHYWKKLYHTKEQKPFSLKILKDNAKVKMYTGLPSKDIFHGLFGSFGDKVNKICRWQGPGKTVYPKESPQKKKKNVVYLTAKEEYFIALFRIKTMLKADIVGDLFGISRTTVSRICFTWWKFMARELGPLLENPSDESHRYLLPKSFKTPQYNNVQHIIDCTEVFTETPKNKKIQATLWSNYKHHHTAKFLVSIAPNGLINFASRGYGGRASDRQIVEHSGFLNEIQAGEKVMADKGFNISDLLVLKHAEIVIPPGRRGAFQMPAKDVIKTKQIANRRIRVEQVIRRIKSFNMLKYEVPISLLHILDEVFIISCAICNLMSPISKN